MTENKRSFRREQKSRDGDEDAAKSYPKGEGEGESIKDVRIGFNSIVFVLAL